MINMLIIIVMTFAIICGFNYYFNYYIDVIQFIIYSVSIVILVEVIAKIDSLNKIMTLIGNLTLSLFDIILIGYLIGFFIHFIFDINLHNVLNISLPIGIILETLNLYKNKNKHGKYYPS